MLPMIYSDTQVRYAPVMKSFGERVRERRESLGWTQIELRKRMGIKSQSAVSQWENNESVPDFPRLVRLAVVLGVPIPDFVYGISADYDRWWSDLVRHGNSVKSEHSATVPGESSDVRPATRPVPDDAEIHHVAVRLVQLSKELRKFTDPFARELESHNHTLIRRQIATARLARSRRSSRRRKISG